MRSVIVIRKQRPQRGLLSSNRRVHEVGQVDEMVMSIDDIHLTQHISFAAPRTRRRPTAPSILRHDTPVTVVSAVRRRVAPGRMWLCRRCFRAMHIVTMAEHT